MRAGSAITSSTRHIGGAGLEAFLIVAIVAALALATATVVGNPPGDAHAVLAANKAPEDSTEKQADLKRAIENGGASPDRLVVVYERGVSRRDSQRLQARQQAGGRLIRADARTDALRVAGQDAQAVAQQLRHLPGVRDAYPDQVATIDLSVNDPMLRKEWGVTRIQAPTAWDISQGAAVKVAVLDCGIHSTHPDLVGKVVLERNFSVSATTDDLCNHGTHVAGTIGAVTNNGAGVAAVAPLALLMNGKVLSDAGAGFFSDIDTAIKWAADNGAKVISMSLGGTIACPTGTQLAADYAWSKGVVLVAAAGNSGASGAIAPANCRNVIGVAASDSKDIRASFSNYGTEVDVAAPGVGIESTVNSTLNGGAEYDSFSGTSMATPHVAGVLALIWATNLGTGPTAVRDRLFSTADQITGTGDLWTYGRINAASAVAGGTVPAPPPPLPPGPPPPAAPATLSAAATPGAVRLTWASSTGAVTYIVYRGGATDPKAPLATGVVRARYTDRGVASGQMVCYVVTATNAGGESAPSPEACIVAR